MTDDFTFSPRRLIGKLLEYLTRLKQTASEEFDFVGIMGSLMLIRLLPISG
jgi:hypothetical protein